MDERAPEPQDAIQSLRERSERMEHWFKENAPEVVNGQSHLDADSEARASWNYGYLMALRDVLGLIDRGDNPLN